MSRNISIIMLLIIAAVLLEGMANLANERSFVDYETPAFQDTTMERFDDIVLALDDRLHGLEEADSIKNYLQSQLIAEQKLNATLEKDLRSGEVIVETLFIEPLLMVREEGIFMQTAPTKINEDSLIGRIFELEEKVAQLESEKIDLQVKVDSLKIVDIPKRRALFKRKN